MLRSLVGSEMCIRDSPNHQSRQVRSGHFVEVLPTPLKAPELVAFSQDMARELELSEEAVNSEDFTRFFSGDTSVAPHLRSWCTPYALSIFGEEMYRQCPFQNGNGYGDGRAISVGEVLTSSGQRWELQLKGAGPTPFCRGADGRAVLRSSVREFVAQEAMHHLGVCTTRSLSLVVSGQDRVARQWYSDDRSENDLPDLHDPRIAHLPLEMRKMLLAQLAQQTSGPDITVDENCAITCRVAPSFIRVGQVELFGRRARKGEHHEQLEAIVAHAVDREFADCVSPDAPLQQRALVLLRESAKRIQRLTADWIRVGFAQGNFNSDNCLVAGRTMDYGPFGFVERYSPSFALWVGSGDHFGFLNQPKAGFANFRSLTSAVVEMLDHDGVMQANQILEEYLPAAQAAVKDVWRRKLGFTQWEGEHEQCWEHLHGLMERSAPDYTIMWRELAGVNQAADGATALRSLELAFYSPLSDQERAAWSSCLDDWLRLQRSEPGSAAERAHMMKQASPKYVPREWLLVEVYKAAIAGDRAPLEEMMEVMSKPYDEHPQMEERFYRKCPPELLGKGGIAHMT
eukprot:TRINITY_DN22702_c0_g1_i2.p1 TRINITY_DN22702_c0_g1~~TRINITY_DN22702_c0_g1_i2.p1  ORF type:complete len:593 (+),score=141.88 TRINITY_DN22702_c0_g1_i2:69-1781(+)